MRNACPQQHDLHMQKGAPCPPDPIPKHQATQVTHSGLLFVACLCVTVTDLRDFPPFGSSPASGLTHFIIQSSSNVSQSHTEGIYCTTHNFSIAFRETSGEPGPMVHWQKKVVTLEHTYTIYKGIIKYGEKRKELNQIERLSDGIYK